MNESPSWPFLTGLLGSLAGVAALAGLWLNRRRVPAEVRLITLQGDVAEATTAKTRAEAESLAVGSLEKALNVAERRIGRLESEVKLLEGQNEQLNAQHKCDAATIEELRARLDEARG